MKIVIEKMKRKHINEIYQIECASFYTPWSKAALTNELKNKAAYYFVAIDEKKSRVMGYGGFWRVVDEANINNIAVHPDYRGKHIGDKIMQILIEEAQKLGLDTMFLEVRRSNEPAQSLYRKHGFQMVGVRNEYYVDNKEDAIVMLKALEVDRE